MSGDVANARPRVDPVLKRNDGSPRAQHRRKRMRSGFGVVELDQEYDEIDRSDLGGIGGDRELWYGQISEWAFDLQPAAPQCFQLLSASDEGNVAICRKQASADVTAKRAGAHDRYAHGTAPTLNANLSFCDFVMMDMHLLGQMFIRVTTDAWQFSPTKRFSACKSCHKVNIEFVGADTPVKGRLLGLSTRWKNDRYRVSRS
jgi:hypothetical protein